MRGRSWIVGLGGAVALGMGAPGLAWAQDFERVAPKPPPRTPVPEVSAPPTPEAVSGDQTVMVPQLTGLVFVDGIGALQTDGVDPAGLTDGVYTASLPLLSDPEFLDRIRPYLGRPLTRSDLDRITGLVSETYRAAGHPFIEISVPPQNVQSGVIQIVVTEYRVGEVRVEGNEYFSDDVILRMGDLRRGETLTLPRLRTAVERFNENPFLSIDAVVEPGAETGYTDVVLQAEDRSPARVYVGYDNQGVPTLGRDEWYMGANWGNAFGQGSVISYQFTRSFTGEYFSHSASAVIPMRGGDKVLLFGAYSEQSPDLGFLFDSEGQSGQASVRYVHNLPDSGPVSQSLQIGFDYKRADSNLEFFGFRILDTAVEVAQFPLVYNLSATDRWGQTDAENVLVLSPGDMTSHNTTEDLRQLVPGVNATYLYDRLSVTRTTFLPGNATSLTRVMAQLSTGNLPYSEQIGGGGIGSVRGYDTNSALGSEGILFTQEFRAPPINVPRMFDGAPGTDWLQFGVFWDFAYLKQDRVFPDVPNTDKLSSIGINAHYNVGRYFNLQLELGHQLLKAPFAQDRETRLAMIMTLSF
ncbi:ShlB/FhaC/HecB family hemolysin secretion/activation protein [Brevundimonas lenta]|nr:ShlB/FhaC/HecB family hemolysin secretion/activation protein [Brevundimonas lenta]